MSKVLQVSGLHKSFVDGKKQIIQVLKGINFEAESGESLAIIGQSGVGKSTLLHILGGLDAPSEGKVLFKNKNIHKQKPTQICEWRNQNLGFVFQAHHLLTDFNAIENVSIPAIIGGVNKKLALEKAEEILVQLGLQERTVHKVMNLSGGEQQRVAIARALINNPEYILADEPTGNLDEKTGTRIGEILTKLCETRKISLLIATHNRHLASMMKTRFILQDGLFCAC